MSLDSKQWEYFDFIKIFEIRKGFYNKKPDASGMGDINFIGATDNNNGVTEKYTIDEIVSASRTGDEPNENINRKLFPAHAVCVTNNGSVGYAYYQKDPFTCSHDVNPLYRRDGNFNLFTGLFVATVIMHDRYRWGYGRKWRPERMIKSKLKLPIMCDDNKSPIIDKNHTYNAKGYIPDWDWMENYIKSFSVSPVSTNIDYTKIKKLGTKKWEPFIFGKLIKDNDIYKAKAYSKIELETRETIEDGYIRFVSRTEDNNGVDCYVFGGDFNETEQGNAITIGDTTSTVSYQAAPFVNGDHIVVIRSDWLNKYTGLFIVSLLQKERFRYSYGRAFLMESIKKTRLFLPILSEGDNPVIDNKYQFSDKGYVPDWEWIENYMKSLPYSDRI